MTRSRITAAAKAIVATPADYPGEDRAMEWAEFIATLAIDAADQVAAVTDEDDEAISVSAKASETAYAKAIAENRHAEAHRDAARAAVDAYLQNLPVEFAGKHKHAGISLVDEEGDTFEDEDHLREAYADFDNCTLVSRRVTAWAPLPVIL